MYKLRYEFTDEDKAFCKKVTAAGPHEAKYHTLALVEDLLSKEVPGDFAECGVLYGAHPAIMLYVLKKHGITDRSVHLFDSFEGIPKASAEDMPSEQQTYGLRGDKMEPSGVSVSTVDNTVGWLRHWGVYHPDLVVIHKGWFEETLPKVRQEIGPLALLRVDVDLYSSTKAVYENLYDKVVPWGYVVDDDYGFHDVERPGPCRRAMEEVIGSQSWHATPVEGHPTTSWWRKGVK